MDAACIRKLGNAFSAIDIPVRKVTDNLKQSEKGNRRPIGQELAATIQRHAELNQKTLHKTGLKWSKTEVEKGHDTRCERNEIQNLHQMMSNFCKSPQLKHRSSSPQTQSTGNTTPY